MNLSPRRSASCLHPFRTLILSLPGTKRPEACVAAAAGGAKTWDSSSSWTAAATWEVHLERRHGRKKKKGSPVCGLERKYDELWQTKGRRKGTEEWKRQHVSTWNSLGRGRKLRPVPSSTAAIWSPFCRYSLDSCHLALPDCPHSIHF